MKMHRKIISVFGVLALCFAMARAASTTPHPSTPVPSTPAADVGIPAPGGEDVACSDKKPCADKNSKCTDARCVCNEGYAPVGNDTCLKSPGAGDTCRKGSVELFCHGFGVDYQCPNNSVCVCRPGYEDDGKGACKAAVRNVGDACKNDGDCTAAFTECQKGKCACIEGFKADSKGSLCIATDFNCPNAQKALQEKGSVRLCELTINITSGDVDNDTCPTTHFCNAWQNSLTPERKVRGHCCPKPAATEKNVTITCPVGVEHKTAKCLDLTQFEGNATLPPNACPQGNGYDCLQGRHCCPMACRSGNSFFNVNGKCYDSVILDQPCEFDAQCLSGAECRKGTCQCKSGYTKATPTICLAPGEPNPFVNSPAQ